TIHLLNLHSFPTRRSSDLSPGWLIMRNDYLSTSSAPSHNIQYFGFGSTSPQCIGVAYVLLPDRWNIYLSTPRHVADEMYRFADRSEEHTSELQSPYDLVCR